MRLLHLISNDETVPISSETSNLECLICFETGHEDTDCPLLALEDEIELMPDVSGFE